MFDYIVSEGKLLARTILFDSWYASSTNLKRIHRAGRTFFTTLKSNRLVRRTKESGYQGLDTLEPPPQGWSQGVEVRLKEVPFGIKRFTLMATNGDIGLLPGCYEKADLAQVDAAGGKAPQDGLTSIKWHLWYGNAERAVEEKTDLNDTLAAQQDDQPVAKKYGELKPLSKLTADFQTYVEQNSTSIVDSAKCQRCDDAFPRTSLGRRRISY